MTVVLNGSLALLGAGKMGTALLSGWLSAGIDKSRLQIIDPAPHEKTSQLIEAYDLAHNPMPAPASILVIAVKPQILEDIVSSAAGFIDQNTLILSVAAGRTLASLQALVPADTAIVRTMPNTPAEIAMGISVACANSHVSEDQKRVCDELLGAVGDVAWVEDEILMDAVTAISGSGPAYVFYFGECLEKAGVEAGLDAELAQKLARATLSGAGALLHHSELPVSSLRENVTSPGGTTAAALEVLMSDDGMLQILERAVQKAKERSKELSA